MGLLAGDPLRWWHRWDPKGTEQLITATFMHNHHLENQSHPLTSALVCLMTSSPPLHFRVSHGTSKEPKQQSDLSRTFNHPCHPTLHYQGVQGQYKRLPFVGRVPDLLKATRLAFRLLLRRHSLSSIIGKKTFELIGWLRPRSPSG